MSAAAYSCRRFSRGMQHSWASELLNEDSDVHGELTLRRWLCADVSPKRQEPPTSQDTEIFRNYEAYSKGHSTLTVTGYCLNLFCKTLHKKEMYFFKKIEFQMPRGMLIECNIDCRRWSVLICFVLF